MCIPEQWDEMPMFENRFSDITVILGIFSRTRMCHLKQVAARLPRIVVSEACRRKKGESGPACLRC